MIVEMHNPVGQLLFEVASGHNQKSVAMTYAYIMSQEPNADWPKINAAISERWPKGLVRVKEMAWRFASGKKL